MTTPDQNPARPPRPCPPWCTSTHKYDHGTFIRTHLTMTKTIDLLAGVHVGLVQVEEDGALSAPLVEASAISKTTPNGHQHVRLPPRDAIALADVLDAIETDSPTLYADLADALRGAAALATEETR